jgi:sensor histidine kinase regulating citrate/malate metabolism
MLQPVTERVRADTQIAFITIMAPDRTRFTHTNPQLIGQPYLGTIDPALQGRTFTEVYTGTLGPSIRAVAPVRSPSGAIVGLVSAGITQQTLFSRWQHQWPKILLIAVGALMVSLIGVWAIRRRLLRQTHGLAPTELQVMYEHHDAILHSVSEGLIVLDRNGVALANDEARRLLSLPVGDIAKETLPEFLRQYSPGARDEVHVTGDRVLVSGSRLPVSGHRSGDHSRPYRTARGTGRTRLHEGVHRVAAVAGPRVGKPAAHNRDAGGDGTRRRGRAFCDHRTRVVTEAGGSVVRIGG